MRNLVVNLNEQSQAILSRLKAVHKEICDLASGEREWEMCIPAQRTDSDLLLQSAVDIARELLECVERKHKALRTLRNEVRGTLHAHELAIRYDSGNTNWACLEMALTQAEQALTDTDERLKRLASGK